mmetsp:Transcript_20721/g.57583  ORF Transcript_20721/g.57583 Transcript_20721/m.57583 type:complete len:252 (-) Transcript_20721:166-921(-)
MFFCLVCYSYNTILVQGDIEKAVDGLRATLKWRIEFGVDAIARCFDEGGDKEIAAIVRKESETCKMYARGYDKDGRAIVYMRGASENSRDETGNLINIVHHLEKGIACSRKNGMDMMSFIIDYEGFRLRDAPSMSVTRKILDILQSLYPERMHRAYICNPPFVFRTFWALVKPFIDPATKRKIMFCTSSSSKEKFMNNMGPANIHKLEACAGGTGNVRECDCDEYLSLPFDVTFDEYIFSQHAHNGVGACQ